MRNFFLPLAMAALTLFSCVPDVSAQQSNRLQRLNINAQDSFPDVAPNASFQQDSSQNGYQQRSSQQNHGASQPQQFVVRPAASAPPPPPSQPLFGKADAVNLGKALLNGFVPVRQTAFASPPNRNTYAPLQGSASGSYAVASIDELKRISNRDVVIIIDKSGSMSEADCPSDNMPATMTRMFFGMPGNGSITRWEWCQRQTFHVASQLQRVNNNIKLVLFDSRVSEFNNVSMNSISDIFNQYRPGGGTNATKALKTVVQEYFDRKKQFANVKPLSIVFITDGAPASPTSLKDLIVETSLKMNNPNEISLSFLQIGNDDDGARLLPELDYNMVNEGARFDFVSCRPFASVARTGLLRALLDTAR